MIARLPRTRHVGDGVKHSKTAWPPWECLHYAHRTLEWCQRAAQDQGLELGHRLALFPRVSLQCQALASSHLAAATGIALVLKAC